MRAPIAVILILAASPLASAGEEAQGWCLRSKTVEGETASFVELETDEEGRLVLVTTGPDGAITTHDLKAVGVNEYAVQDMPEPTGVIFRADGKMQVYNSGGTYATADESAADHCKG